MLHTSVYMVGREVTQTCVMCEQHPTSPVQERWKLMYNTCIQLSQTVIQKKISKLSVYRFSEKQKPGNSRPESSVDLRGAQLNWANELSSKKNVFKASRRCQWEGCHSPHYKSLNRMNNFLKLSFQGIESTWCCFDIIKYIINVISIWIAAVSTVRPLWQTVTGGSVRDVRVRSWTQGHVLNKWEYLPVGLHNVYRL